MSLNPTNMNTNDVSGDTVKLDGPELCSKNLDASMSSYRQPEGGGVGDGEGLNHGSGGEVEENVDMEVEFVESSGSRAVLEGSEGGSEGGRGDAEGGTVGETRECGKGEEMDCGEERAGGVEERYDGCDGAAGKGFGENVGGVESVIDQESSGKASFIPSAQQLFPNSGNGDGCGKEMKAAGNDRSLCDMEEDVDGSVPGINELSCKGDNQVSGCGTEVALSDKEDSGVHIGEGGLSDSKIAHDNQTVGTETEAAVIDKEINWVHVNEGGFSEPKGDELAVESDACAKHDGKKRKKKGGGFYPSDLVWGKVRSHPWWPAQIFEAEDASDQAKKHFRSKSYLVAYFGDQSFAWNDEAKLKPFVPHFSQMVKQSTMESFRHAVDCILHEAARRVEFALSCHCIDDDVFNRLKTQVITNAGIRENSSSREGGDRLYDASSFEPEKFLDYVKHLAQGPHVEEVDRLEHLVSQAQMSAFYRWKGCYHLAEFGPLIGYVNNEADAPVSKEKEEIHQMIDDVTVAMHEKVEEHSGRPQKRKRISASTCDSTKKSRHLSDIVRKKSSPKQVDDEEGTEGKAVSKSISPSAGRRKEAKLSCNQAKAKESSPQSMPLKNLRPCSKVGESILRVVGQLNQPSPILKLDMLTHGKSSKAKGNKKQSRVQKEAISFQNPSPDEILSQLLLAAVEPLEEHGLLGSMITFVSDFRNSVVPGSELMQLLEASAGEGTIGESEEELSGSESGEMAEGFPSGSKSKEKAADAEITAASGFKAVEDACCGEKIMSQTSLSNEKMAPVLSESTKSYGISAALLEMDDMLSASPQKDGSENAASERGQFAENIQKEESPTALTLKFADMESIPTEAKLNMVFSAFGPLKETETEVMTKKKCARVVFQRSVDAETAFSSSGKFGIFGASLVCYQLNYAPSPRKSTSGDVKRKKDEKAVEGTNA